MFIDEMFEDLLVEKKVALLDAMADVCKEKLQLKEDRTFDSVKRIEKNIQKMLSVRGLDLGLQNLQNILGGNNPSTFGPK